MKRVVLALGMFWLTTPQAPGWVDAVDHYVASLKSPEIQQALGLKAVRRPERIANRLEVTFERHVSPIARSQTLQRIGQEFLQVLFRHHVIPMVIVVERNTSGRVIGSITVSISGRSVVGPESVPRDNDPC